MSIVSFFRKEKYNMNVRGYNLTRSIRYETDEQKLHILLLNNKKYISDNVYELLTLLGPNLIGRIFCVLDLKSIKLICMNIQDQRLLQYVPEEYHKDILKLFKAITSRDNLTMMYAQLYCYIKNKRLRQQLFYIVLENLAYDIIKELNKDANSMTDNEFLLLYNKHKRMIKRYCNLVDIKNLCFKFEHLFLSIDSELFYREIIKDDELVDEVINCGYKNMKQSTYNKIKAYSVLKNIRQEVI